MTSIIKCANGYNHYGQRDTAMNKQQCNGECPRCSKNESWEYVVQCKEIRHLRKDFVKNLLIEMLKERPKEVDRIDIFDIIEDILKYLDEDEEGDFETSQEFIGFKYLFRGIVMRDWKGSNLRCRKYRKLNKILVKHCALFYKSAEMIEMNHIIT